MIIVFVFCIVANDVIGQAMEGIKYIKVSGKEAKKVLKKFDGKLNSSIDEKYFVEVYELNNGQSLMDFSSHGFLFNSLSEAISYLENIAKTVETGREHHILEGKFGYDESFTSKVSSLERELINNLGKETCEHSEEELNALDKFMNVKLREGLDPDKIYGNLVAYIGEYMRSNLRGAKWQMTKTKQGVWEPYIVESNGNRFNPFIVVYKELYEYYPEEGEVALAEHTKIELVQYRIKPRKRSR